MPTRLTLACCICVAAGGVAAERDSVAGDPAARPYVTIDRVLQRNPVFVRNLQWLDCKRLIGEFVEPQTGLHDIRVVSIDDGAVESLGSGKSVSPSPDGRSLIHYSRDGWRIRDLSSGRTVWRQPSSIAVPGHVPHDRPVWSRDGRYVAIVEDYRPRRAQVTLSPTETVSGVRVIDFASVARAQARWRSRIIIVDRKNGPHDAIIPLDDSVLKSAWGPDGALYIARSKLFSGESETTIGRIVPDSLEIREIYSTPGRFSDMVPAVSPSGDTIALVFDVDNRTWDDFQSLQLIDSVSGRELRRVTHELPLYGGDYFWSLDGGEIYVRARNGGLDQIHAIPLGGEPRRLTRGIRRYFDISLSPDGGRISAQTEDGYGRRDIRILELATGEERSVLLLDDPAREFTLGRWRQVRWTSTDDVRPFGFLLTPPSFDARQAYPMIVDVHGGGEGSRLYLQAPLTFAIAPGPLEWHAWTALGYVVFVPDYRSTGEYGPAVIRANYARGELAAVRDVEDIVSGTRFVLSLGFVDPSRVAVLGHSAGGERVFLLLTRSEMYAAAILNEAVAPDPLSIFIEMASGGNTGGYPAGLLAQLYGGKLDDRPERYKANYIFDSYRIKTPTLIMTGNEELGGTAHLHNEIIYSILNQHGVPSRMLTFADEGHNYSRPESARLAFETTREWLETHMPPDGSPSARSELTMLNVPQGRIEPVLTQ